MKPIFRIIVLSFICCELSAATYHVSKAGSDTNNGSQGSPFLTVQKGVNTARAGDTVLVGAGTYAENVSSARSGMNGAMVTIDGQGAAKVRSVIIGHAYNKLQNLTIGPGPSIALIYIYGGADFCVFSNNIVDAEFRSVNMMTWNGPYTLPFGDAGSDNLIISNTFQHGRGALCVGMFGDRNVFFGNRFINHDAVDVFRPFGRSNSIVANLVSNVFESGTAGNHPDFLQVFGTQRAGSIGTIIESNIVIGMHGASQLCMMSADDVVDIRDFTFRNNLFIGVSAKGTVLCNDVKWYNNLFYHCSTNAFTAGNALIYTYLTNATYTNFAVNGGHGGRILNNIFLDCGDFRTNSGWYSFPTNLTNVVADFNLVAKSSYGLVKADPLRRPVGNASGWEPTYWWEPNGINGGNPQFVNVSALDFRLSESSPLINRGVSLNFRADIAGVIRPQGSAWDIGPNEFSGAVEQPGTWIIPAGGSLLRCYGENCEEVVRNIGSNSMEFRLYEPVKPTYRVQTP